ncbi:MAG: hypothetical protein U1D06_12345 [Paracoccaceae bacterium]|nr:hypothetical protein [Paracoccaceae bacterium]
MNSRSYFNSALAPDFMALIEAGNPALALEWLMDFARRPAFAPEAGGLAEAGLADPGLVDAGLADHCAALAPFVALKGDTRIGLDRPVTLYLATDLSTRPNFGDILSALVQSRPTERHVVLLTGVADAEHAAARAQLRKIGAFALCPPPGVIQYDRLLWLWTKAPVRAAWPGTRPG